MKHYNIADFHIGINFIDNTVGEDLIPNIIPFVSNDESVPMLTVNVVEDYIWDTEVQEIGIFDVGGCNHSVFRTSEGGYLFGIYDSQDHLCAQMQSNADFTLCNVKVYDGTFIQRNYGLNNCLMMSYAFVTATLDTVLIHSSVIRCDGYGYLMTAPSGTGKSTHTHLWYTTIPGCDLLNDDNPIVRIVNNQPIVYGSPWSGKTPCYRNIKAPIGGIVRIKQHPSNIITRLGVIDSFTNLLPACSNMKWDTQIYRGVCDTITKIIQTCNIWELKCLPNSEAAILCHDTIAQKHNTQNP